MARADDAAGGILDLQHVESREPHRRAGVVEQILAIAGLHRRQAEPVVLERRRGERGETVADGATALGEVFLDHRHQGIDTPAVLRREAVAHRAAHPDTEHQQRHEHHRGEREQETGAERHEGLTGCVGRRPSRW